MPKKKMLKPASAPEFPNNLLKVMTDRGVRKNRDLADAAGCSPSTISKTRRGRMNPSQVLRNCIIQGLTSLGNKRGLPPVTHDEVFPNNGAYDREGV